MLASIVQISYVVASVLFILGLKMLGSPKTAAKGNWVSGLGMLIAVAVTLYDREIVDFRWIAVGLVAGGVIGALFARLVAMTAMPEMVALFNGFGGLASMLVGWAEYSEGIVHPLILLAVGLTVLIGGTTFTGSLIAYLKLSALITGGPVRFKGQQIANALVLVASLVGLGAMVFEPDWGNPDVALWLLIGCALAFGVLTVIPIGGADMPLVISLLNAYSGLAACAAGFVINNTVMIVAGSLVGASGVILTNIMCKAMNRSLGHVLFKGFGSAASAGKSEGETGEAIPIAAEDAYLVLEAARSVVVVPGYGMAVAQAQHAVRELGELLEANGAEVKYAIHPVAGRMPGHMNVLLAEANVAYEALAEPQDVNPIMETVDVCIVIGANDVVNPAARDVESSPIYGMPVIEADKARTTFILKRSMASGFAGIDNPLFFKANTRMIFGDAKSTVTALAAEFKS